MIGETDFTSGPSTLHEKAIYIVEGQLYQVERFDFDNRKAFVRAVECDYYTDAITYTKVTILETFAGARLGSDGSEVRRTRALAAAELAAGIGTRHVGTGTSTRRSPEPMRSPGAQARARACSHGEVHVVSRVVGFKKIKFYTNENVGSGELDLPEQQMHTTSYWLTIPAETMAALPYRAGGSARRRDRAGVRDAQRRAAAADVRSATISGCRSTASRSKARRAWAASSARGATRPELSAAPTIFIYDNYPGGIGFSEPLFACTSS